MEVVTENLSMHFDDAGKRVEVFSNLTLHVASGESLAIVGESGVGKSTLLYLLGGLERPAGGEVKIGDTTLSSIIDDSDKMSSFRGANIGFVFQFHHLLSEFSATENVALPLLISGVSSGEAKSRAEAVLERVGLKDRVEHRPGQLSGGEQQRVAVARAFVTEPGVILADEPTGNLDEKTGGSVHQLLAELQRDFGTTVIVVTHSRELASKMDRTVTLTSGGIGG